MFGSGDSTNELTFSSTAFTLTRDLFLIIKTSLIFDEKKKKLIVPPFTIKLKIIQLYVYSEFNECFKFSSLKCENWCIFASSRVMNEF